jgi:hypothetical protein
LATVSAKALSLRFLQVVFDFIASSHEPGNIGQTLPASMPLTTVSVGAAAVVAPCAFL